MIRSISSHNLAKPSLLNQKPYITLNNSNETLETNKICSQEIILKLSSNIHFGRFIGNGVEGSVWQDAQSEKYVFKITKKHWKLVAEAQMKAFNLYYPGDHCELMQVGESEMNVLKMKKINGLNLSCLTEVEFPDNSWEMLIKMIEKLFHLGIYVQDLHKENILYDKVKEEFSPIDIEDNSRRYSFKLDVKACEYQLLNLTLFSMFKEILPSSRIKKQYDFTHLISILEKAKLTPT